MICGKAFGLPDYWQELTISEYDAVLTALDDYEAVERYDQWSRTAQLSYVMAEVHRNPQDNKTAFKPRDFMPQELLDRFKPAADDLARQDWQEMKETMRNFAATMNAGRR